jgi:uncharacterized alpha/beta hydrolase family protein
MLKSKFLSFLSFAIALFVFCLVNTSAQSTEKVSQTTEKNPQTTGKNPVIIVPGISGSQLVNPKTGKTVWFAVRRDKAPVTFRLPKKPR